MTDKSPGEWWIEKFGLHWRSCDPNHNAVHVIEHSAYLAVVKERDELCKDYDRILFQNVDLCRLAKERDRYRAALEHYADASYYDGGHFTVDGDTAREALK